MLGEMMMTSITTVQGFPEQMRKVLGKYHIPTYFKATNTLRQLLVQPKDHVSKQNMVGPVYNIKCGECDVVYVGARVRQGLVNICDLVRRPQRFQNTSMLITPNIP